MFFVFNKNGEEYISFHRYIEGKIYDTYELTKNYILRTFRDKYENTQTEYFNYFPISDDNSCFAPCDYFPKHWFSIQSPYETPYFEGLKEIIRDEESTVPYYYFEDSSIPPTLQEARVFIYNYLKRGYTFVKCLYGDSEEENEFIEDFAFFIQRCIDCCSSISNPTPEKIEYNIASECPDTVPFYGCSCDIPKILEGKVALYFKNRSGQDLTLFEYVSDMIPDNSDEEKQYLLNDTGSYLSLLIASLLGTNPKADYYDVCKVLEKEKISQFNEDLDALISIDEIPVSSPKLQLQLKELSNIVEIINERLLTFKSVDSDYSTDELFQIVLKENFRNLFYRRLDILKELGLDIESLV